MREIKFKWSNTNTRYLIATAVIILAVFVIIFSYAARNAKDAQEISEKLAAEQGMQKVKSVEVALDNYADFMDITAKNMSFAIEGYSLTDDYVFEYMNSLLDDNMLQNIAIINREGYGYNVNRQIYNVKNRDYYKDGLEGRRGFTWVFGAQTAGETQLVYYTPFLYKNQNHELQFCVLVAYISSDRLENLLYTEVGGLQAPTFLIVNEGMVLGASGYDFMSSQLKEFYSYSKTFKEEKFDALVAKAFKSHNQQVFNYTRNGYTGSGSITHFEIYNMMIFQVLDVRTSLDLTSSINESGTQLLWILSVIFILYGLFIIITAIKAREKLEKETRNARYVARAIDKSNSCFYLIDLESYKYQYIQGSHHLYSQLGREGTLVNIAQIMVNDIESDEEREEVRKSISPEDLINRLREGDGEAKYSYKANDKKGRWENLSFVALDTDETGTTKKILMMIQDATDFRSQEAEANYRMRLIQTMVSNFVTVFATKIGTTDYMALRMTENPFDKDPREVLKEGGLTGIKDYYCQHCVAPEYRDGFDECFKHDVIVERLAKAPDFTYTYLAVVNGKEKYYQLKIARVGDGGEVIVGFADVDEQVRNDMKQKELLINALQAAEEASQAKTRFLSNMSHDIRTPMNAVIGFTTLAQTHFDDMEAVREYLSKIMTSSKHLLGLINDVLDMSRIESGKTNLDISANSVTDIMKENEIIFVEQARQKNLTINFDYEKIQTERVYCDKLRVNQILINIIGNAIKFTPEGGKISVSAEEQGGEAAGLGNYVFTIEDNGLGMSPEFLETIWTPFEREQNSTISGIVGTGLGMSITKSLVELMQGDIQVESEQGKGSKFTVTLPLKHQSFDGTTNDSYQDVADKVKDAVPEGATEISLAEQTEKTREFTQNKRILLVEDNEINLEIASALLEDVGIDITPAENGKEALDIMAEADPGFFDLILMDIQMPVMNGYESAEAIRKLENKENATTPIIAMTANAFDEDIRKALDAHMNGHVAKPINVRRLYAVLKAVFVIKADEIKEARAKGEDWNL